MERYELTKNTKIRKWVKSKYDSKNLIIRYSIRSLYFVKKSLYTIRKICTDKEFRAIFYMSIFNAGKVHQTTPLTCMDRYPIIFSACRDYFNDNKDIKILSYGCSTGEEVLTLRKYFNDANIVGAEINKNSLKICRKLKVDNKITFINSNQNEIKKNGKFDLIFCMAVLQRTPDTITRQGVKSLKKIYPFEKFERRPGPLLTATPVAQARPSPRQGQGDWETDAAAGVATERQPLPPSPPLRSEKV